MAHAARLRDFARTIALTLCACALLALPACNEEQLDDGRIRVEIGGETFRLEPAMDDPTRAKGLGGREEIAENGGMIFVFRNAARRYFYMKDCLVDIDIAYLDDSGRIVSMYTMAAEPLQREDETEREYIRRLKQYPSRYPSSVVIELQAGRFADLEVETGDVIELDIPALKAKAQ